jgi:hypothetical protein
MCINYSIKIVIYLLIYVCLTACKTSPQICKEKNVIFSYDLLSTDSLNYDLITPNKFNLVSNAKIHLAGDYYVSEKTYLIDSQLNIRYTKYNFSELDSVIKYRDKIEILGKTYILDSLFYKENFSLSQENRTSILNAVYKFKFLDRQYICFYIQDVTNPESQVNTDVLMLDITNHNKIIAVLHAFQASENLRCFGDFNRNGQLDFALWSYGNSFSDTLKLYELSNDKFILDTSKYIILVDSENSYFVNSKKSKWL